MHKGTWKAFERRVAAEWGTDRTPLSGGNSKQTRSDTRHSRLFMECKHGVKSAFWTLYLKVRGLAQKENKVPVLALGNKNHEGYLLAFHVDDLTRVFLEYLRADTNREPRLSTLDLDRLRRIKNLLEKMNLNS